MLRGYSGYYKNVYLRSSLEFAYAYYLDYKNIKWKYEYATYKLDGEQYKPDFFIFDDNDNLVRIVEIKAKENKKDGLNKINKFKKLYNVPIVLIDYHDILKIYQLEMPIRYHKAKEIFIKEYNAVLKEQDMNGELNPMYGLKQSDKTKKLIGDKCRERFKNEDYKNKFKKTISNRTYKKGYIKVPREKRICPTCGKEFVEIITSKQKHCSRQCNKNAIAYATEVFKQQYEEHRIEVEKEIFEWTKNNRDLVLSTKFNKINSTLKDLYKMLYEKYDIKDERSVSKILKTTSRKEFLKILKEYLLKK